jgi:hypothetical protein
VHVFGLQRRAGETFVDVTHDRLGLIEREAVMLEGRHLGERLTRQMGLLAMSAEGDVDKFVRHSFFRQGQPRAPYICAHGGAIDDRVSHLPSRDSSGHPG